MMCVQKIRVLVWAHWHVFATGNTTAKLNKKDRQHLALANMYFYGKENNKIVGSMEALCMHLSWYLNMQGPFLERIFLLVSTMAN